MCPTLTRALCTVLRPPHCHTVLALLYTTVDWRRSARRGAGRARTGPIRLPVGRSFGVAMLNTAQVGTDVLAVPFVLGSNVLLFVTIPIFGEYERFHLRSSMECVVSSSTLWTLSMSARARMSGLRRARARAKVEQSSRRAVCCVFARAVCCVLCVRVRACAFACLPVSVVTVSVFRSVWTFMCGRLCVRVRVWWWRRREGRFP